MSEMAIPAYIVDEGRASSGRLRTCPECLLEVRVENLVEHRYRQHGVDKSNTVTVEVR
jgi:hypothetical protein